MIDIPDKYVDLIRYYHLELKKSFGTAIRLAQEDIAKLLKGIKKK